MMVTRQIYNENYSTPVVVRSYYTRASIEPRWDLDALEACKIAEPRHEGAILGTPWSP